ncbi:hypothetical protein ES705_08618 [subsurface metagenome]
MISFKPTLKIPNPMIAAVFNCTSEVGIPLVIDANSNKLAVTIEIRVAPKEPKSIIPFPVVSIIFKPKIELPIPKQGATNKVEIIIMRRKLASL